MKVIISEGLMDGVSYENVHLDYSYGEHHYRLEAYIGDIFVGYLDYGVYEGDVDIKMIEVDGNYRKLGVGRGLVIELQRMYPDVELDFGYLTGDGKRLVDSLDREFVENNIYKKFQKKLDILKSTKTKILSAVQQGDRSEAHKLNDIQDSIMEIEDEMRGMKPGSWIIKNKK